MSQQINFFASDRDLRALDSYFAEHGLCILVAPPDARGKQSCFIVPRPSVAQAQSLLGSGGHSTCGPTDFAWAEYVKPLTADTQRLSVGRLYWGHPSPPPLWFKNLVAWVKANSKSLSCDARFVAMSDAQNVATVFVAWAGVKIENEFADD